MNYPRKIITIILFLVTINGYSQTKKDVEQFKHLFDVNAERPSFKDYTTRGNELKFIATSLFLVYKEFISSQDYISCVFHPSCSEYAIQAVQKQGFIGIFNTFDRLTRCNALSPEHYEMYKDTPLFYDPVE
jgi:uncharacterized protein